MVAKIVFFGAANGHHQNKICDHKTDVSVLQIRRGNRDNFGIIIHISSNIFIL